MNRPSSAPHGQPELTADMVAAFAHTQGLAIRPTTHREARLGVPVSNKSSYEQNANNGSTSNSQQFGGTSLLQYEQYRTQQQQLRQSQSSWMKQEEDETEGHEQDEDEQQHQPSNPQTDEDEDQHHHQPDEEDADEESHYESGSPQPRHRHQVRHQEEEAEENDGNEDQNQLNNDTNQTEMEEDEADDGLNRSPSDRVKVAVRCRPLLPSEQFGATGALISRGGAGPSRICVHVQGKEVLLAKSRLFTFDHAFGPEQSQQEIYDECGAEMVKAAFQGYNATIFAYGQTGSGKTFTMGSGNNTAVSESDLGLIPRVVNDIYARVQSLLTRGIQVTTKVSYLEIYQEELKDLLHPQSQSATGPSKTTSVPTQPPITIREDAATGGVLLLGVREELVANFGEMMRLLTRGSISRTTGSTLMNQHSSRSHSIFTITIEQAKPSSSSPTGLLNQRRSEVTRSKFHLVDLAGSERAKRTGAVGVRFKESININRGLLALGNVIQALASAPTTGANGMNQQPRHIPYRESKLTRLLQGSLGGNSRTLMIACISPSDSSFEETHTTLKYAYRAKRIRNKPVVNKKEEVVVVEPEPTAALVDAEANVETAIAAVTAAKDADIERMQEEIERLQLALHSERRKEVSQQPTDHTEEDEDEQPQIESSSTDHPSIRNAHLTLASSYSSLHTLFHQLQQEHAWLCSGSIFFVRNLSEMFVGERRRDESKERVIALRKQYDALIQTNDPSQSATITSIASQIKDAQKSYIQERDELVRLREDLQGFLQIYTAEKMKEMQEREWTKELPQVDVEEEIRRAERYIRKEDENNLNTSQSWREHGLGAASKAEEQAEALRQELSAIQTTYHSLQSEYDSLAKAHAVAQEDLKYDDEIFEEKVKQIKELSQREKERIEEVEKLTSVNLNLKAANKKLAEMMKEMGEEIVKKLAAGVRQVGGVSQPPTARGQDPTSAAIAVAQSLQPPMSARFMESLQVALSPSHGQAQQPNHHQTPAPLSPLKSGRNTNAPGFPPSSRPGTSEGGRTLALTDQTPPDFFRAASHHLAASDEWEEEQDEMRVAHDHEGSMDMSSVNVIGTPPAVKPSSRTNSRPGTATKAPTPAQTKAAARLTELHRQEQELDAHLQSLTEQYHSNHHSLQGLASHIASRKQHHFAQLKVLETQLRDIRIQFEMKRTAWEERTAASASSNTKDSGNLSSTQQLRAAEQHYQLLEQELSLKQRLLSALSPRKQPKPSDPKNHNSVRIGIEVEVRELEQKLKEAARELEELQLGGSGPAHGKGTAAATNGANATEQAQATEQLRLELQELEITEHELQIQIRSATEEYQQQHGEDRQTYKRMESELHALEQEIGGLQLQLDALRKEIRGLEGIGDGSFNQEQIMDIQVTSVSGNNIRPPAITSRPSTGSTSSRPTTAPFAVVQPSSSQLHAMKRKTQWLSHQVTSFLTDQKQLEEWTKEQEEQQELQKKKEEVEARKNKLLQKSLRASGMGMKELLNASMHRPTTAGGLATVSELKQSLQQVDKQLSTIQTKTSQLLKQNQSLSTSAQQQQPPASGRRSAADAHSTLATLHTELQHLESERASVEQHRQHLLARLTELKQAEAAKMDTSISLGDGEIIDASIIETTLTEDERRQLQECNETLDDLEVEIEFKLERMEEMKKLQQATSSGIASARPPTAAETDPSRHQQTFLAKASEIFDPSDPQESSFIVSEFIQLQLEKQKLAQQAAESEERLKQELEEKEMNLKKLEQHVAQVMEANELRLQQMDQEYKKKLAAVTSVVNQSQSLSQSQSQHQNTSPQLQTLPHPSPSSSALAVGHSLAGLSSTSSIASSKSPVSKLAMLKSHMQQKQHHPPPLPTHAQPMSFTQTSSNPPSQRPFGPSRTFTPANLPMGHTPLLYNASPTATPRSSYNGGLGGNELSPSRSLYSSQRSSTTTSNVSSPLHNSSAMRQSSLSSLPPSQANSKLNSPTTVGAGSINSSMNTSAVGTEDRQRLQLSLLKRKHLKTSQPSISQPSSVPPSKPSSNSNSTQSSHRVSIGANLDDHDEFEDHDPEPDEGEDDDAGDFSHSNNFLSARAPSSVSLHRSSSHTSTDSGRSRVGVPQLKLDHQVISGSATSSAQPTPTPLSKLATSSHLSQPSSHHHHPLSHSAHRPVVGRVERVIVSPSVSSRN